MSIKIRVRSGATIENRTSDKAVDWLTIEPGEYELEDTELVPDKGLAGFCDSILPDVELIFYDGSYEYI